MINEINAKKMVIIRKLIDMSDKKIISEKTGFSIDMVKSVLGGRRYNQDIINCTYDIAKQKALILLEAENLSSK